MARRRKGISWRGRLAGAALLVALLAAAWFWWQVQRWTPSSIDYPEQGAEIGARDGKVRFRTLRALGARFVYLDASSGADRIDPKFASYIDRAQAAGLKVGAIHDFDPCVTADPQSANFVTIVPREATLLPPVIALDRTANHCVHKVRDAAVESELMTLINQIEAHAGKRAILKISRQFEDRYHLAGRLDRNLWVIGTRFQPTYAGRPWLLWTANARLDSLAASEPIRWVVVQP